MTTSFPLVRFYVWIPYANIMIIAAAQENALFVRKCNRGDTMHVSLQHLECTIDLKFQSRIVASIDAETNNDSDGIERNDVIVSVCPTSRFQRTSLRRPNQ